MWDAVYGGLEGTSLDKTARKSTKVAFQLVKFKRKKYKKNMFQTGYNNFLVSLDEYSYNTPYLQDCSEKNEFENIFS